MEEQHKNILKIYNYLSTALIIIISSNIWFFYTLNRSYDINMAKIMEKVATIEKEIVVNNDKPIIFETKHVEDRDIEDLREYISIQYPNVIEKDIDIIASEIKKYCLKHGIDFSLIVGLIEVESSYNKFAKSNKDSFGLMQIRYKVWGSKLGIKDKKDLYRIKTNISLGVNILKYYIDQNNGNITKALQNYNGTCDKKFPNMVYSASEKFVKFRLAYGGPIKGFNNNKNVNSCIEKVKIDGKDKNRRQSSSELGKRKRLSASTAIQRKHKTVHK